jgi:hypothetical protein
MERDRWDPFVISKGLKSEAEKGGGVGKQGLGGEMNCLLP